MGMASHIVKFGETLSAIALSELSKARKTPITAATIASETAYLQTQNHIENADLILPDRDLTVDLAPALSESRELKKPAAHANSAVGLRRPLAAKKKMEVRAVADVPSEQELLAPLIAQFGLGDFQKEVHGSQGPGSSDKSFFFKAKSGEDSSIVDLKDGEVSLVLTRGVYTFTVPASIVNNAKMAGPFLGQDPENLTRLYFANPDTDGDNHEFVVFSLEPSQS
jgi:hypothetical protein